MPLVWHERSFAAVVAGVSIKQQQVLESMPCYEKKETQEVIYLQSEVRCEEQQLEELPLALTQDEQEAVVEDEIAFDDDEYDGAAAEEQESEDYLEYYEQYENQFASRLSSTPRQPRSRISTITQRTVSSNLRILSSACDTRSVCKPQLRVRTAKPKPSPKPARPATGNFKVKSPYISNIVRQDPDPAYEDWCKKMEIYNATLKSLRQLAERTFDQKITAHTRGNVVSKPSTSEHSLITHSPTPRLNTASSQSQSVRQSVRRRPLQSSSHHRSICERGSDRWAKVLNQRALVKTLIKQRQAVQTRREQCNRSFAKGSSKKVKEMCKKAQKAKGDHRHMTTELKAPQQWLTQYQQSLKQTPSTAVIPTALPAPRRTRILQSICDIARPTLGRTVIVRERPVPIAEPEKPEPPTEWEEFEMYRRSFFERNRMQIDRAHHQDLRYTASKVTLAAVDPKVAAQFMKKRENLGHDQGSLLYHGTRSSNIPSILQKGFLIPDKTYPDGTRIRVQNGSSYGVGVYASHDPSFSTGYTGDTTPIFICAVLKTDPYKPVIRARKVRRGYYVAQPNWRVPSGGVRNCGNICVIFEESRIVPLFMLHFAQKSQQGVRSAEPKPEPVLPSYKKSSRNWFQEQRKQASRPLKFVSAQTLRETLHKKYATIRKNRAASKNQMQLA